MSEDASSLTMLKLGDLLAHTASKDLTRRLNEKIVVALAPLSPLSAEENLMECFFHSKSIALRRGDRRQGKRRKFLGSIGGAKLKRRSGQRDFYSKEEYKTAKFEEDEEKDITTILTTYYDFIKIQVNNSAG